MECPKCQTPNRAGANFCKECGSLLIQACPRCGSELPEAANFCDRCGLRLADPAAFNWWATAQAAPAPPASPPSPGRTPEGSSAPPLGPTSESRKAAPHPATPPPAAAFPTRDSRTAAARSPLPGQASPPDPALPPASSASQAAGGPLQQYIPEELLKKLETARVRGEMVGERRVVTMLFCDVKGSTAAADRMDPEEWSEIINGAFEHMIQPVYKYEGTVARLMGDGILAFFGAPIAHEDDPQRAVLAGLDIVAGIKPYREEIKGRFGFEIDLRVGINTGLVVVGTVGSDLRMEYTALGDAINLAARMEQTAKPGTVQIAQDTYKLVKPMFEFEALGGIEVKGKSEPVPAYRVLGRKVLSARVRGIEGLHAEIVGRDDELRVLQDVMGYLKQGVGRIVCIFGDAGLGKSRLVSETRKIFKDVTGSEAGWYETSSLSYETNQAYGLFQRLIRRMTGIAYDDPHPVVRQKLASLAEGLPAGRSPHAQGLFEALFGLEIETGGPRLEGEPFKQELAEVMRWWWRAKFSDQPGVIVFDDMHWSDAASIELLRQLLPLVEEISLVLICALRAERQAPAWSIRTLADEEFAHRYTQITLHPLSDAESSELVNRLLTIAELPDRLRASILEKSGGNPFFIEEVVRSLIENRVVVSEDRSVDGATRRYWRATSEGAEFTIPDNVQALLASRLDRLEEDTRGTLQMASVIGRSFYHRVLQAVDETSSKLDQRLGTLLRLEMIREAARVPELEYAFRNPLTQEAVYKTILLKRRREFHRRVGEAMERLYPDRIDALYGLLAYHFALSGQRSKAIEYSRLASRQAISLYAYEDAVRSLQAALELIEPAEGSELHLALLEELADVYGLLRDWNRAIAHYQQALDLWRSLPDPDPLVSVRLHRKIVQGVADLKWTVGLDALHQANESRLASRASLEENLALLEAQPPHLETVRVLVALSTDAWRTQNPPDWDAAQRFAQSAVDLAGQLESPVDLSQALGALATVLDGRSLLREHLQITLERLAICQEAGFDNLRERMEALRSAGAALAYVGEYRQALPYLQEAESLAVHAQVVDQQTNALGLQAQCWFRLDHWDEVLTAEEKWRDLERRYTRERVGET